MLDIDNSTTTNDSSIISVGFIIPRVKFWFYLIFLIPSIICTLFLLYYLLSNRNLRRSLNNHVIIVLLFTVLFCEVTMYPWMLYYFCKGDSWQRSYIFCSIWAFIDWAFYAMQIMLFAWASIERHILIFHHTWFSTRRKRFFLHYLPIALILIYYHIFYFIVYFYSPCENDFIDSGMICFSVGLYDLMVFRVFETMINNILPDLAIVIFSMSLIIRIIRQKQRMNQPIRWRQCRKMTIQLLSISFLYLIVTGPNAFMVFLYMCGLPDDVGVNFTEYAVFLTYFIVLLFPFVSMLSMPELLTKIKTTIQLIRPARLLSPEVINMRKN
ncbi:unnamed protein product [Adineta steineri]|uniref:G-protein coupled receptors family 1 profile domain-containing protein n=1 Tax=Adineta steineri TaxID=433720 RepID=A0A819E5A3_9BILA|nr:unnamed protein product [Adineta steineri]